MTELIHGTKLTEHDKVLHKGKYGVVVRLQYGSRWIHYVDDGMTFPLTEHPTFQINELFEIVSEEAYDEALVHAKLTK